MYMWHVYVPVYMWVFSKNTGTIIVYWGLYWGHPIWKLPHIHIYIYLSIYLSTYQSIDPSIYIHLFVCDYADWVSGTVALALELTLDEIALWWFALLGNLHELQHKGLDVGLSY